MVSINVNGVNNITMGPGGVLGVNNGNVNNGNTIVSKVKKKTTYLNLEDIRVFFWTRKKSEFLAKL